MAAGGLYADSVTLFATEGKQGLGEDVSLDSAGSPSALGGLCPHSRGCPCPSESVFDHQASIRQVNSIWGRVWTGKERAEFWDSIEFA